MRVLIVGGGIAGLATARALRLRGLEAEVVERDPEPRTAGAGVYLPGNGIVALRHLGMADEVIAHGAVVERRRLLDEHGRSLIDFDEAGLWHDVAPPIALHRRVLHEILLRGAEGTPIRFGVTVTSLEARADAVDATFSDGTTRAFDLVVGADGVHSWVRQAVVGGPPARPAGQVGWRWVVEGHPEIDGWNGWLGPDRAFLALAIGGGRVYGYADIRTTDPSDPTGGDPSRLAAMFDGFAEPVGAFLAAIPPADVWFAPIEEVTPTWGSGRIVLVGDAAHASSPNMAEGASLAIEDAWLLAEALADRPVVGEAIDAFIARRSPRIRHVQATTHRRDRLRYAPPWIRRLTMAVAGRRIFHAHYRPLLDPP